MLSSLQDIYELIVTQQHRWWRACGCSSAVSADAQHTGTLADWVCPATPRTVALGLLASCKRTPDKVRTSHDQIYSGEYRSAWLRGGNQESWGHRGGHALCYSTVTVEKGPLPSTPDPCYRKALAAELVTDDRTQRQGSRQSGAHRSVAEGWSPIWSAPQTRWWLLQPAGRQN